jgi:cytochrome b involved in lipid metabolism
MTKKIIGILALLILIVGAGFLLVFSNNKKAVVGIDYTDSNTTSSTTQNLSITIQEVSTHKDATSCWSVINGSVYNLSIWIGRHPGGEEAILAICGKDGSFMFDGQHGDSKKVLNILEKFKIGTLK